ncbi:DsbA family protein [Rhizobium sullae]|jgi:protein-disulfide isomerase|uniref:Disulfide bond formation protein DsbA n=1 Tax=Rhizobium sullae TaxID=50338 RepID=A0A2N0D240_RHISU|nr:DsbA family protein [Rhizobium sullae]PKA40191.1 disulfide bond formation protein DsbA [Rhizobium sullae]TCU19154.1 protein-disulfide isomerase [Rhizobium sullae]UWU14986.1 DsbA family protein [Rhizobium sullae]
MLISEMQLTKRQLLSGMAAATATLAVASATNAAAELPQPAGDVDMTEVLKPGPLPEMALGKEDAPVTIVEYMSMTCPHCAHFHNTTFDEIKKKYVDAGKARFIIREFPFDPAAAAAFMLARCNASKPEELSTPEQYFPMVSMLFKQQETWAAAEDRRAALLQMAKLAGFSEDSFTKCLTNQKLLDEVNATRERGSKEFGIDATPTFLINGKRYSGDMPVDTMSALIDSLL